MKKSVTKDSFDKLRAELYAIKEEVRNDVIGPVVASFGFIIALVWRDAIKGALDHYLETIGLAEKAYLYNFVSAIIVTLAVIVIMISVTKWGRKKKKQRIEEKIEEIKGD